MKLNVLREKVGVKKKRILQSESRSQQTCLAIGLFLETQPSEDKNQAHLFTITLN